VSPTHTKGVIKFPTHHVNVNMLAAPLGFRNRHVCAILFGNGESTDPLRMSRARALYTAQMNDLVQSVHRI
jgi:hypothetical protein